MSTMGEFIVVFCLWYMAACVRDIRTILKRREDREQERQIDRLSRFQRRLRADQAGKL